MLVMPLGCPQDSGRRTGHLFAASEAAATSGSLAVDEASVDGGADCARVGWAAGGLGSCSRQDQGTAVALPPRTRRQMWKQENREDATINASGK